MLQIEKIKDIDAKNWLQDRLKGSLASTFNMMLANIKERGYTFDYDSGLFFKQPFEDKVYTTLGIIFPRPATLHYHTDVSEFGEVLSGNGVLHIYPDGYKTGEKPIQRILKEGEKFHFPKKMIHAFYSTPDNLLEIKLLCDGILNPKKEICVETFPEYWIWQEESLNKKFGAKESKLAQKSVELHEPDPSPFEH